MAQCVIEELHDDEPVSSRPVETAQCPADHAEAAAPGSAAPDAAAPQPEAAPEAAPQHHDGATDAATGATPSGAADSEGTAAAAQEAGGITVPPDDAQAQQLVIEQCERLKQQGNAAYAQGDYDEALQLYWQAIDQAPEDAQQRAVYLCNAAACYIKKEMWQLAAEQCTQALKINETYIKALTRRSHAFEQLDDLEHALADAQRVLELEPGNSWATKAVEQLQAQVQERQEKMKEEMIGKLKDLGNSLLGKFGLSLDNFQAEQDPATGGYSIKFVQ